MKKLRMLVFSLLVFIACGSSNFEQVDYFKDAAKNRVFCIYTTTTDADEISNFASSLMNTAGHMTTAYFYNDKSKIVPISARSTHDEALEIASETDYFMRFDKYPTGKIILKMKR